MRFQRILAHTIQKSYLIKMLYAPLKASLFFLIFSIIYFLYGPVYYSIDNKDIMLLYLFFYIVLSVLGYLIGIYFSLRVDIKKRSTHLLKVNF